MLNYYYVSDIIKNVVDFYVYALVKKNRNKWFVLCTFCLKKLGKIKEIVFLCTCFINGKN